MSIYLKFWLIFAFSCLILSFHAFPLLLAWRNQILNTHTHVLWYKRRQWEILWIYMKCLSAAFSYFLCQHRYAVCLLCLLLLYTLIYLVTVTSSPLPDNDYDDDDDDPIKITCSDLFCVYLCMNSCVSIYIRLFACFVLMRAFSHVLFLCYYILQVI